MKSYLFTTETDRGGVMLCDIEDFDTAVEYLCERFDGVVRVEAGEELWQLPVSEIGGTEDDGRSESEPEQKQQSVAENDLFA